MRPAAEFLLFGLSAASVAAACVLACALTDERRRSRLLRPLLLWSAKGLLVPLAIWALMNLGLSWNLQPFMPQIQAARNNGDPWLPVFLRVMAVGLFIISSYWTTVTLALALFEAGVHTEGETRAHLKALCLTCFIALVVPALFIVFLGGWPTLGLAGIILLTPMAGYGASILHKRPMPPIYARAMARMNFGRYTEAEWEIIHELEKCEDDFDGWMMLAGLYANQFNDLAEAEQSILEICDQPKTTPPQLAIALHRLADWQLQRAGDPAAAQRALQMICDRLPGTHLAHMAQLRMNHLPATAAELRRQQTAAPIPLPALSDTLDEAPAPSTPGRERHQAAEVANDCVESLKRDPNNVSARERLARLLAEQLAQPDQALEQVRLLLDMPGQPDARRAEWLGLIAAWHIRYRHDTDAGRAALQRLLREFPHSPQAFAARRRLRLLDADSSAGKSK
jgi:hypothetical protein